MISDNTATVLDQRDRGRREILSTIRSHPGIARIDLAEETGMSTATVTTITAELLAHGLVEETPSAVDDGKPRRGRPRVDLKVARAAHLLAGSIVTTESVTSVLVDFSGEVLNEATTVVDTTRRSTDELAAILYDNVSDVCKKENYTVEDLSAVGVGIPGIVDTENEIVYWSPVLATRNAELQAALQSRFPVPTMLENEANLVALAEAKFGIGKGINDFIVVSMESGVGMGIVFDGQIYRGARGCGAEFGHTKVQLDGALCRCGQRGCLEAYVADYALLREAESTLDFGDCESESEKIARVVAAAGSGEKLSTEILKRSERMFSMGLANIVNIFDPRLIVLTGTKLRFNKSDEQRILENIRNSIAHTESANLSIVVNPRENSFWAKGAAFFALELVSTWAVTGIGSSNRVLAS